MKVKARLLCRAGQNLGVIQIVAYHNIQQKEISIGKKIEKRNWDDVRGLARGQENMMLNIRIRNAVGDITNAIDKRLANKNPVELNEIFDEIFTPVTKLPEYKNDDVLTIKTFLSDFIEENPDKISQASMNSYRTLLGTLNAYDKTDVGLVDVNVEYVNKLYDFLRESGLKPSTIQTRFIKLKKIVNTAIIRGLMTDYPFGKGKLTVPCAKAAKRKYLNNIEIDELIQYAPTTKSEEKVMRIVKFNLHVGLRIGDVFTLKKNNITTFEHPTKGEVYRLTKTTSKTETDVNILLTNQAKQQVIESGYVEIEDNDLIFPWLKESDFEDDFILYKSISAKTAYFNKILGRICVKIGIKKISSHSLRHTFCTSLITKGVPITSISKLVGHSDVSTTMIYSQVVQDTVDDAISVLEA